MAKPMYYSLILLVLCLINEAYGQIFPQPSGRYHYSGDYHQKPLLTPMSNAGNYLSLIRDPTRSFGPTMNAIERINYIKPLSSQYNGFQNFESSYNKDILDRMDPFRGLSSTVTVTKTTITCCVNDVCYKAKEGEECKSTQSTEDKEVKGIKHPTTSTSKGNGLDTSTSKTDTQFNLFSCVKTFLECTNYNPETNTPATVYSEADMKTIPHTDSTNRNNQNNTGSQNKIPLHKEDSNSNNLSEDDVNKIRNEVLDKSNYYRKKFNIPPLTLDNEMNEIAQKLANRMAKSKSLSHSNDNTYGENLFASSVLPSLGENAVNAWYNELSEFKINDDEMKLFNNHNILHFTQLLWKKSTKLGVGFSKDSNNMYYVAANYDPPGNVFKEFKANLPEITQKDIEEASNSNNH